MDVGNSRRPIPHRFYFTIKRRKSINLNQKTMANIFRYNEIKDSDRILVASMRQDLSQKAKSLLKQYYPNNIIATASVKSALPTGSGFDVIIIIQPTFLSFGKLYEDFDQFLTNLNTRRTRSCLGFYFINQSNLT